MQFPEMLRFGKSRFLFNEQRVN